MNRSTLLSGLRRLTLTVLVGSLLASPHADAAAQAPPGTIADSLYVSLDRSADFMPLDPLTLADLPDAAPLAWPGEGDGESPSQPDAYPEFAAAADGSTVAYLHAADRTVAITDGWGGPLRLSIPLPTRLSIASLSHDGRYLTLAEGIGCGPSGCGPRAWHTYDALTGALIATTRATDVHPGWPTMFAPNGTRLYEPVFDAPAASPGPWPIVIVAYDLLTGQEIARLPIPRIRGGNWPGTPVDGMYVGLFQEPAIALDPDGSTIALIDPAMTQLVTIDTGAMTIVDTHDIGPRTSPLTDLLAWLGIVPRDAAAKLGAGRSLHARWSHDGQSLFVTGYETRLDGASTTVTGAGFGVTRIDAGSGDILGHVMAGLTVDGYTLLVTPDGTSLYVMVEAVPWWKSPSGDENRYTIYRLDPHNLDSLAARSFAQWPHLRLLPAPT